MLIHEHITQIQETSEKITQTLDNLKQIVQNEYDKAYSTALQKLHTELKSALELQAKATLGESLDSLKSQNSQDFSAAWHLFQTQALKENKTALENAKESLQNELLSINEQFLQDLSSKLPQELLPPVQEALETSLKASLEPLLLDQARDFLSGIDFRELLEYEKITLDTQELLKAMAAHRPTQIALKSYAKESSEEFLQSLEGRALLKDELKANAVGVFKEALKADELIKMRYESALRLSSLQLMGLNELLSLISQSLAKEHFKPAPPSEIKNNVLVSK